MLYIYVSSLLLSSENTCGTMRLELTLFSSINDPLVGQTGLYRGHCSSFLECVYFGLLYQSLIFDMFIDMCVCVCVCVCVGAGVNLGFVCVYHGEFCGF